MLITKRDLVSTQNHEIHYPNRDYLISKVHHSACLSNSSVIPSCLKTQRQKKQFIEITVYDLEYFRTFQPFTHSAYNIFCAEVSESIHRTARETTLLMNRHVSIQMFLAFQSSSNHLRTSGFLQTFASTHHSSLMMPAWGLLLWKMTRKNTYKRNSFQIRARMLAY